MKKNIIVIHLLLAYLVGSCQNDIKPLKIGDQMPAVITSNVLNYSKNQISLSDFKGKLLILDFWSIHCASCIKEMPEMQAYQEKFKDQIQIILVTSDSKNDIQQLHSRSKYFSQINLPMIYNDSLLLNLFPYTAYGLHVWIDQAGMVRFKTDSRSYTADDISKFLKGDAFSLTARTDTTKFERDKPIWMEGGGRQMSHAEYYSIITGNLGDYAGSSSTLLSDSVSLSPVGVRFINCPIPYLFFMAYKEWGQQPLDSVAFVCADSTKYFPPLNVDQYKWILVNTVSYELKLPLSMSPGLFTIMRQDLERYFQITGTIDSISVKYLCLTTSNKTSAYKKHNFSGNTMLFNDFIEKLQNICRAKVIADPDSQLPSEMQVPALNSRKELFIYLDQIGLELRETTKTIKILRLTENNQLVIK